MFRLLKLQHPKLSTANQKCIISSHDWVCFMQGIAILKECNEAVIRAEKFLDSLYEKEIKRGYEEGLEQARMEMAAEQIQFSRKLEVHFQKIQEGLVELICTLVEKIVGEMDERDRMLRMIGQALNKIHANERVTLSVAPQNFTFVKSNISRIHKNYTEPGSINVEENLELTSDQCVVECGGLVIEISLESHIRALRRSFLTPGAFGQFDANASGD